MTMVAVSRPRSSTTVRACRAKFCISFSLRWCRSALFICDYRLILDLFSIAHFCGQREAKTIVRRVSHKPFSMVQAVLFDLFETLITESGTRPAGVSSLAPELGCEREAFRAQWKARRAAVTAGCVSFRE